MTFECRIPLSLSKESRQKDKKDHPNVYALEQDYNKTSLLLKPLGNNLCLGCS